MEHTTNFKMVQDYYNNKLWSIDRVFKVTGLAIGITQAEYQEITGFVYPNKA